MADVTIKYKGATIAEMSGTSEKTLKTGGTYCEGDIDVVYAPRTKTYEITLAKASGWVLLTTLDEEVMAHINDQNLRVSLSPIGDYTYVYYAVTMAFASNERVGVQGNYPVYGIHNRVNGSTSVSNYSIFYPANNTGTSTSLGSGQFRLNGSNYYFRPFDGYLREGTYRLTFTW